MSEPDFTPLIEAATQRLKEKFERDVMRGEAKPWFAEVRYAVPSWWPPHIGPVDQSYWHHGIIVNMAI